MPDLPENGFPDTRSAGFAVELAQPQVGFENWRSAGKSGFGLQGESFNGRGKIGTIGGMVPAEGVEPTHPYGYQILSLARLPIPPRRQPLRIKMTAAAITMPAPRLTASSFAATAETARTATVPPSPHKARPWQKRGGSRPDSSAPSSRRARPATQRSRVKSEAPTRANITKPAAPYFLHEPAARGLWHTPSAGHRRVTEFRVFSAEWTLKRIRSALIATVTAGGELRRAFKLQPRPHFSGRVPWRRPALPRRGLRA